MRGLRAAIVVSLSAALGCATPQPAFPPPSPSTVTPRSAAERRGYLHFHAHVCADGTATDHRHFHPIGDDGKPAGGRRNHHILEGGDVEFHKYMSWSR